jgi:tetratricopeptide (TPR) repeat protein/CHAT domain-containing protein
MFRQPKNCRCIIFVFFISVALASTIAGQEARWEKLNGRVVELYQQGKYAEALTAAQEALKEADATFGAKDPRFATSLNNLAEIYREQGKYSEAEPRFQRALEIREKALGPNHPDVAQTLSNLGAVYQGQGKYGAAESRYQRALEIEEKALGPNHRDVATSLNNLAGLYMVEGKYAEAESRYQRALEIEEKALGPNHPLVATSLNNLAALYEDEGKYAEAESRYQRALGIEEKALGPNHPLVATSLNNLAALYKDEGKYAEAESRIQRALQIEEKALGPNHPDVALSLNNLALLYVAEGKYAAAEPQYQRALQIEEKALGPNHPDVALSLNNLADLYREQDKYVEAEPRYQRALEIREKALGPNHPDVATSLNNLALLYVAAGKYAAAEPRYQRALEIREKALGPNHPDVALSLNNLAWLYVAEGKYAEAEPRYLRALEIREKALGPSHPDVATSLDNLATLYQGQGKHAEAEPRYLRALEIREKALGPNHPYVALSLNNLALLYMTEGKYAEAEPRYLRALEIWQTALGPNHPEVGTALWNLGVLYSSWNQATRAQEYFERALHNLTNHLQQEFGYMTEEERLGFLDTLAYRFPLYFSFCFRYREQHPELTAKMYDVLIWQKGMVVSGVAALRAKVAKTGDKEALALQERIMEKRTQVARLTAVPLTNPLVNGQQIQKLNQAADDLDRELMRRIPALAEGSRQFTWQDVRGSLKPNEAAVEFVRFKFYDGKKWTGKSYYAALVLKPEAKDGPKLIALGDAETLECGPVNDYRRLIGENPTCVTCSTDPNRASTAPFTPTFYDAFWKPLESTLGDAKRIYISPDGVLNQISFAVLSDDTGKLLIEENYDLRAVMSTRDLLREPHPSSAKTAVLIGDPLFTITDAAQEKALAQLLTPQKAPQHTAASYSAQESSGGARGPSISRRSFDLQTQTWDQREGTKIEVDEVGGLLQKKNWKIEKHTEADALEEAVRRVQGPRLLHVATHGFFLTDQDQAPLCGAQRTPAPLGLAQQHLREDPMLRSGLVFTGANRIATGKPAPQGMDNGILTAYEATGLDLEGTELVVLSACDTGLGETRTGEGVFGLRRAFQVAGAESILMTMWEVDDTATQQLMQLFYSGWLAGEEKHQALREAQLKLRQQIKAHAEANGLRINDIPLWGAFVLVGP